MHVYIYEPFLLSPALKTLLINPTLVTVAVCNFFRQGFANCYLQVYGG